jgi:hypothetical protein
MNHLGLYSNANSGLISDLTDKAAIVEALRNSIASEEQRPEGYKYGKFLTPKQKTSTQLQSSNRSQSKRS